MEKLMSMTDFVLNRYDFWTNDDNPDCQSTARYIFSIKKYAEFLKQPLTLGMFVPVDENGNVLEEPSDYDYYVSDNEQYFQGDVDECIMYVEAKEKVLFKDAVTIDESPYKMTNRLMVNLNHPATFRIYNKFLFNDGRVETDFLPNFSSIPTIEYLVGFDLELTPYALKQIGINQ